MSKFACDRTRVAPCPFPFLFDATATLEGDSSVLIKGEKMASVVAPTLTGIPMTVLNYTLPPPIYLPSSGGYTSSRFTEDVGPFCVTLTVTPLLNYFL
jgi:hypothetical protein